MTEENQECINALRIAELDKRLTLHIGYQQAAVQKAADELHERLAAMNEFRDQLRDQASRFITRDEMDIKLGPLEDRVEKVSNWKENWEGRLWAFGVVAGIVGGLLGAVLSVLFRAFRF